MRRSAGVVVVVLMSTIAFSGCRRAESQVVAAAVEGSSASQADGAFTGTVAESLNAGGYTYVRLQAPGKDEVWVAAPEFDAKVGQRLTVALEMPMRNFESQTLKRKFDLVYFVQEVRRDGESVAEGAMPSGHPPVQMMNSRTPSGAAEKVEPVAPPPGGLSIAQLWAKRKELAGKEVVVRGRVVKANNGILDTNWVHLQDGSGSEADRDHDITITTSEIVQIGDVITFRGVLAVGKEIGSGYAYDAIIEKASVVR